MSPRLRIVPFLALAAACGSGAGHGGGDDVGEDRDAGVEDGGGGDDATVVDAAPGDGGTLAESALCGGHHWTSPLPVTGTALMAFRGKAYLFSSQGQVWTVIEGGAANAGPIPFPAGVTSMQAIGAELGLDGLPLVTFRSNGDNAHQFATRWDGTQFSPAIETNNSARLHADAAGRIYGIGAGGLFEYPPGAAPIARGTPPRTPNAWTVSADGTIHVLFVTTESTSSGTAFRLEHIRLPHGSLSWSSSAVIAMNVGQGFSGLVFAGAPDGSLHVAWERGGYLRSRDGETWETSRFTEFAALATLIDPATANDPSFDPRRLVGTPELIAAQDYDHAAITTIVQYGSTAPSSTYFARRCPPFVGPNQMQWPAERFAYSYSFMISAVDERGLAAVMTPNGVRQDVIDP
ncbi:MAG TPA: hypothetical protein VM513_28265 [Kofleriaceae bacterium]|nr:hypothetical protein [Kofleriaceae bacterium]